VVITHAADIDPALRDLVRRWHGAPPIAWTRHAWTGLRCFGRDAPAAHGTDWLAGRRVVTLLGIGNARPVHETLASLGAIVERDIPARDHEHYTAPRLRTIEAGCRGADALVMTGKDWVKARHLIDLSSWPVPVVVPDLRLEFRSGEADLRTLVLQAATVGDAPSRPSPDP
jgi:tetraacyldisaccharide-1-P 4'-kinase